jgi:hypothetical protein
VKIRCASLLTAALALSSTTATAADISLSGFGTLGYAQSDQSFNYLRSINNKGTFNRDSVFGVQADAKLTDTIGATVQGKLAPSLKRDASWDATVSWAFLSWRPSNEMLIRLGKQRSPAYLYSESMDVGATYDFARLPTEVYSLLASTDYIGGSLSNTWNTGLGELTVDGYLGKMNSHWRFYQRDNYVPPGDMSHPGANNVPFLFTGGGAVLTLQRGEDRYRTGLHRVTGTTTHPTWRFPSYQKLVPASTLVPAGIAAFVGGTAYTVLPEDFRDNVPTMAATFGAEIHLPYNFRIAGEYARRKAFKTKTGVDTQGAYLSLLKDVGAWTPYISYAALKSRGDTLSLYQELNASSGATDLTGGGGGAALTAAVAAINASQRVIADGLSVFDQNTVALGTSYRITPTQKLKVEWARTHVGIASSLVDAPAGGDVSNKNIHVFSFSYNVVF